MDVRLMDMFIQKNPKRDVDGVLSGITPGIDNPLCNPKFLVQYPQEPSRDVEGNNPSVPELPPKEISKELYKFQRLSRQEESMAESSEDTSVVSTSSFKDTPDAPEDTQFAAPPRNPLFDNVVSSTSTGTSTPTGTAPDFDNLDESMIDGAATGFDPEAAAKDLIDEMSQDSMPALEKHTTTLEEDLNLSTDSTAYGTPGSQGDHVSLTASDNMEL